MRQSLRPDQLRSARRAAGLTQDQAANRLRVSQAYLALLEGGLRPVTVQLGAQIANLYGLGAIALPPSSEHLEDWDSSTLAAGLASLGYPGFRQLTGSPSHNPATILLAAIAASNVEVRVLEALPWLAAESINLDWEWLIREAKIRDLQNRLGFIVTLARQVAEKRGDGTTSERLREIEEILDRARLDERILCVKRLYRKQNADGLGRLVQPMPNTGIY